MVKNHHKKTLQKALKLKKVDPQVILFCKFISSTKNFFTSSTCSGRIVLLKVNKDESKRSSAFLAKWHQKVQFEKIKKSLSKKTTDEIWFKQEPFIMHVGCKNLEYASQLLQIAKECGIKRAGIIVAKKGKFLLEIIGTQKIAFPIKNNRDILIDEKAIKYILKRANNKLEKNYLQLTEFVKICRQSLR